MPACGAAARRPARARLVHRCRRDVDAALAAAAREEAVLVGDREAPTGLDALGDLLGPGRDHEWEHDRLVPALAHDLRGGGDVARIQLACKYPPKPHVDCARRGLASRDGRPPDTLP